MRFPLPGLLALLPATATLLPLPAQAGPYLYVGLTTISSNQACLNRAEALLKKYKLTEGLEVDRKEYFEAWLRPAEWCKFGGHPRPVGAG